VGFNSGFKGLRWRARPTNHCWNFTLTSQKWQTLTLY